MGKTGYYIIEDQNEELIDSIKLQKDPYNMLNTKNAILLNCRDSSNFDMLYKKNMEKYLKRLHKNKKTF